MLDMIGACFFFFSQCANFFVNFYTRFKVRTVNDEGDLEDAKSCFIIIIIFFKLKTNFKNGAQC